MKKTTLILFLICIFLIGCENIDMSKISGEGLERIAEEAIVCNSPYIRYGSSCCLDQNNNNVCDDDEIIEKQEPQCEEKEYLTCWGEDLIKITEHSDCTKDEEGIELCSSKCGCEEEEAVEEIIENVEMAIGYIYYPVSCCAGFRGEMICLDYPDHYRDYDKIFEVYVDNVKQSFYNKQAVEGTFIAEGKCPEEYFVYYCELGKECTNDRYKGYHTVKVVMIGDGFTAKASRQIEYN